MKTLSFALFILCFVFIVLLWKSQPLAANTDPNRISFAISGGASMGAYEAGLIWGSIKAVRQIDNNVVPRFGGEGELWSEKTGKMRFL